MKLAVVCASGIGDALIFHSLSAAAHAAGWDAVTYSNPLSGFGRWLVPGPKILPHPSVDGIEEEFASYDAVLLQHDNSPKAFRIQSLPVPVYAFYGAHLPEKHGLFRESRDFAAHRARTMVENANETALRFFQLTPVSPLSPPPGLIHKRFKRRILIHPTASSHEKIWPKEHFLKTAEAFFREGYEPVFVVAPAEWSGWDEAIAPATLEELASLVYESGAFLGNDSGPAHLASLLKIPHLVIGGDGLQMPLWKPGWHPGALALPPSWLMRFKAFRRRWKLFIPPESVIKNFKENVLRN